LTQDQADAAEDAAHQVLNLVPKFTEDFERLVDAGPPTDRRGRKHGKDDLLVTEAACKR